jgi:3-deoxy-manno-octulosonate cytidylyltransferase (CMP-KDO synthetase)
MIIGVIPARYKSTRFPGKPLEDICGKPMVVRVWEQASKAKNLDAIYVATDDERIESVCKYYGIKVLLTSSECRTGTDRVAEVAKRFRGDDIYVNIQGDEPLIDPAAIDFFLHRVSKCSPEYHVFNSMIEIFDPLELINPTVPKVAVNRDNDAIYLSRAPVPFPKSPLAMSDRSYYKQLGMYAFTVEALGAFTSFDEGVLEAVEGVEILRFIENHWRVKMISVVSDSIAVDTPDDLQKVRTLFSQRP